MIFVITVFHPGRMLRTKKYGEIRTVTRKPDQYHCKGFIIEINLSKACI